MGLTSSIYNFNKKKIILNIDVPKINDVFIKEKTELLSNNEKIQFMGINNEYPYYLFYFENTIFYLKIIAGKGFSLSFNKDELENDNLFTNKPNKTPNERKVIITLNKIDKPIKNIIFHLEGGLKIGLINTIYSRDENNKVEHCEYLLIYKNIISVLSYNYRKGYSIINNIY